jgi:hypothetical protein
VSFFRRILVAVQSFFIVLFRPAVAEQVARALGGESIGGQPAAPAQPRQPPAPKPPQRSEALTLLATLQREARLVDFLQESLGEYSDAQIGAAVRDVHRDAAAVLQRLFDLRPVLDQSEGAGVDVPVGFDAGRFRLVGNVTGEPPYRGRLTHHGWEAGRVELPQWSGTKAAAGVVAPAEVELSS